METMLDPVQNGLQPGIDEEVQAMDVVAKALRPMDEGARRRVLTWAMDRFDVPPGAEILHLFAKLRAKPS